MISHVLDNPVWNALRSGNSDFALGNDRVKFFPEDVGPFAGMENINDESFQQLYHIISANRAIAILSPNNLEIPVYWKLHDRFKVVQMICGHPTKLQSTYSDIVPLEKSHIPQMIALTRLTHPGPFLQRTIEFGNYNGIFNSDKLVAMAGRRMHVHEYVEISAVCTHPDYTGKGYGKSLINNQLHKIIGEGNIPFLHVRKDNEHAIALYEYLGFTLRAELNIYIIRKSE